MKIHRPVILCLALVAAMFGHVRESVAQPGFGGPPDGMPGGFGGPPPFGPGGFMQTELKVVKQFDTNQNGWLETGERGAARAFVLDQRTNRSSFGPRGGRPPGGPGRNQAQTPERGANITPAQVKPVANAPLYDPQTMRTLFFEFESADWERELSDFHGTDVDVPAKLTVDGRTYPNVGLHFRGMSSFMMLSDGQKRSLNVSLDLANENQRLYGYRTLNLLNAHEDPSFLRTVLYLDVAREYLPAPKANFVRVVINGENWGVYVSAQQFNKDLIQEWFGTTKGARWKVSGSPMGRGGLEYIGENVEDYKKIYDIKSKDEPRAWADLIQLCKVLNEVPTNRLESALAPLLNINGALMFLALENVFINNDGYWIRGSDYNLYQDVKGRFHVVPHDVNETFSVPGGPGFGGPRGRGPRMGTGPSGRAGATGAGLELDPLVGLDDATKPLRSKLLAVPALRARYLEYVRELADKWLDWNRLGPRVAQYQAVIGDEVKLDTKKLDSTEAFFSGATNTAATVAQEFRGPPRISLKAFAEQRRAFLLNGAKP